MDFVKGFMEVAWILGCGRWGYGRGDFIKGFIEVASMKFDEHI